MLIADVCFKQRAWHRNDSFAPCILPPWLKGLSRRLLLETWHRPKMLLLRLARSLANGVFVEIINFSSFPSRAVNSGYCTRHHETDLLGIVLNVGGLKVGYLCNSWVMLSIYESLRHWSTFGQQLKFPSIKLCRKGSTGAFVMFIHFGFPSCSVDLDFCSLRMSCAGTSGSACGN